MKLTRSHNHDSLVDKVGVFFRFDPCILASYIWGGATYRIKTGQDDAESWDYFPQTLFPNQAQLERQRKRHWRAELVPSLKLDRVCLRWSWLDERWRSIGVSVEEFFRPAVRPRPCVRTYLHVLPAILHWQGVYGKGCTGQKGQCWMILSQRWNVRFDFTVDWCFVCKGVLYIIYIIMVIS